MDTQSKKGRLQYWFVLWELTKRELRRKYARSYLGILWSCLYPLLRMALVVFLFSYIFSKGIERYPAYYFSAFLIYGYFRTGTETSLTTLKDNQNFLIKTKLPRELLVLSRVLTAFVNMLLGAIPFLGVLLLYRAPITWKLLLVPIDLFFLTLFVTGVSYAVSIWFVFLRDAKNIYGKITYAFNFFVAQFYALSQVPEGIQKFIKHNPPYTFVHIARECIVYGNLPEAYYFVQMVVYGVGFYVFGKYIFKKYENRVVEKL